MLTRRQFVTSGAAAVAVLLAGCLPRSTSFTGKVLVVGAGPAGMTATHLLVQQGIDVEVLEAGSIHGGRIRHNLDFADFPISLGAEWVHVDGSILDEIVNDSTVEVTTELVGYQDSDEIAYIQNGATTFGPLVPEIFDVDTKFRGSSWLDFYNTYVTPGISDLIRYSTQIVAVDHSGDEVVLTDATGRTYSADRTIITVPLRILQRRDISFTPPLEADRLEAIDEATVWSGLKAFFEFDEAFYPAGVGFPDSDTDAGQRLFYDAAYGQRTDQNILGVFSVGAQAEAYQVMTDDELVASVLADLDDGFDGIASRSYRRHLVQNWNAEPFAGAAYLEDEADFRISRELSRPLGDRVFFAGDSYTSFADWSSVHAAARSAAEAVEAVLR